MELNVYANRLGLNHWDLLVGMVPWLSACHREGLLDAINGQTFDLNDMDFWVHLLHDIAYRQGMGDALAEGGWRAALDLDLGVEYGLIDKRGAYFRYGDTLLGQGRENAKIFLAEDPALLRTLENLIRAEAGLPELAAPQDLEVATV